MALDRPLTVTFFSSFAASSKREEQVSLHDLVPRILSATSKQKGKLPWLKLARFGDKRTDKNSLRHNDNVLSISGIEADYDEQIIGLAEASGILRRANLAAMLYTSPSHTEDTPRWRVLCPLSQDYPPAARVGFLERLNGVFQGALSGESFTLSQSYYYGSVDRSPSHAAELIEGDYLDARPDLDEGAIGKPKAEYITPIEAPTTPPDNADRYVAAVIRNALGRVSSAGEGQKHHTLRNQAKVLGGFQAHGGYSEAEAVEWLMQALPSSAKDKKAARTTAMWGFEQGVKAPLPLPERPKPNGKHPPLETVADPDDEPPADTPLDDPSWLEVPPKTEIVGNNVIQLPQPEQAPSWKNTWHRSDNLSPLPTLFNALITLRNFRPLIGALRYDEMQLTPILSLQLPGRKPDPTIPRPLRDKDVIAVQEIMQNVGLRRMGKSTVQDALDLIASEHSFHPIREYLNGLVWDKTTRIAGWLGKYLGVEGDKYPDKIGKLFLIALVARVFQPGCQADYVLVLEGPQGAMKSSACRVLAGQWFSDSLPDLTHADPIRLSMHLRGKWLIEIAELASFNASETETIKAFATRTHETYTPKYGHNEVTEPRQCLLIASTNQGTYLHDETGARRFWPVSVGTIDLDGLREIRDQLFAEAVHCYRAGEPWWPEREFEAKHIVPQQAARYEEDAWEGVIEDWLAHELRESFTITEIAKGAISMNVEKLGTREQRRIRKVLIQLKWVQGSGRKLGRKWFRPGTLFPEVKEDAD